MVLSRNQVLQLGRRLALGARLSSRQTVKHGLASQALCTKLVHTCTDKTNPTFPNMQRSLLTRTYSTTPITAVKVKKVNCGNELLEITWDDDVIDKFPYVWLRDCCLCENCYVFTSKARKLVMQNLDPEIRPENVMVDDSKRAIAVTWQGGHVSEFSFEWLHQRAFNNRNREVRQKWLPPPHELWGRAEMDGNIPTDTLENILNDDKALFKFLFEMEKKGFYLLKEAPLEVGQLERIAKRVSFPRTTNYGVTFHVQVKSDATNPAYTSATLGLHTDLPFYEYLPGIWLTHCIKQYKGDGGSNEVADGFYVAEKMRRERPDLFKVLTETPIDYYDVGHDHYKFYLLRQGPIIKLNQLGCVTEISYNNQDRDYYLDLPPEKVKPLYSAMRYWDDMLYRKENHIVYKLEEGDVIVLDNRRVLHGRTGFEVSADSPQDMSRHLEGAYLDWDEVSSRRRVLQQDLGFDEHPPIY